MTRRHASISTRRGPSRFRALRPVRHLIETVRAIEAGTLGARVPTRQTGDELDELGRLFNSMLEKIAALIVGMRRALDSVAHDLRTPMTRVRGSQRHCN